MVRRFRSHAWAKCKTKFNFDDKNSIGWQVGKQGLRAKGSSLLPLALRPSLPLCVIGLTLGFSFVITSSSTSAASITLTVPSTPLSLNIGPDGVLKESDEAEVSVETDSLAGYTLTVQSSSEENKLKGDSNELLSIPQKLSLQEFSEGAEYVNHWGYKPDKLNGENNSSYIPGPTTSALAVIDTTKGSTISPNKYKFAIAAKADSTTQDGTYSDTFTLCVSGNGYDYYLKYELDGGKDGPSPNPVDTTAQGNSIELSDATPKKELNGESLEFKGWCTIEPTDNNTDNPTCKGGLYQPGNTYILCDSGGTNITQHPHFV